MSKSLRRKEGKKDLAKKIYIFCEGKKTEFNYFKAFKTEINSGRQLSRQSPYVYSIEELKHTGESGVAKNITFILNNSHHDIDPDDYIVCLIDCDANKKIEIEKAIKASKRINNKICEIHICFSNPLFELWYLLHYQQCTTCLNKETLDIKLKTHDPDYEKNDPNHYNDLFPKQEEAIKNAKQLEKMHKENGIELLSIESNPSTMVHIYITKIRELMQKSP